MLPRVVLLSLLAGCATGRERGPPVAVSAARAAGGLRIRFRRLGGQGSAEHVARLDADGGQLDQVLHSPDRLTVSVLWREPAGTLRCAFPYGGVGRFRAGTHVDGRAVEYVFLKSEGIEVTAQVPAGCLVQPFLPLHARLAPDHLPGSMHLPGGRTVVLEREETSCRLALPRDRDGVLAGGDLELVLRTANGDQHLFLVGVDPDGTPSAVTGFVRNW
ncbi:MAG: hypothetical protein ACYTDU_02510 [Planctomycetota bacterium]